MKNTLKWLDDNLERTVCVVLMSVMTVITFIQVIMRYIFHSSLTWSEELVRYCFIWLVYIGASYGCRQMSHIKIDAALGIFPRKLRDYIVILGDFCVLALASYILLTGLGLVQFQVFYDKVSPAIGLPMAVVNMAPVVGFTLVIIRQLQTIWKRFEDLGRKKEEK